MSPDILPLLRELGDLKRIRSAGRGGTIAARLFGRAWSALMRGEEPGTVALATTAAALAAARLGDLDADCLAALGLDDAEVRSVVAHAIDDVAAPLAPGLRDALRTAPPLGPAGPVPAFVGALADQPRAGVTCPGRPRIVLQPPENHAEHCVIVAVYGVLLSPVHDADPTTVFTAALAHHLHNAAMPDSGFTGEMLLGDHLAPVMERASAAALAALPEPLRATVEGARRVLPDAETPEGRAFHAADVIDRVLEIAQHLVPGQLTTATVLGPMGLVHDGPVKSFHDRVLAETGLAA